ncbi:MAG: 4-oxalomesaconate tautomerase [Gammaproteobacteria bacterium]|nr:4-oxalomesaconate tautomerase [Gammaproteobacteria bacterium]
MAADLISIPCTLMRGGTSKGPYFLSTDLPADRQQLAAILLAVMGSPDVRQIDGIGGADTLTSKVAIVGPSDRDDVDVEYLFAQVSIDKAVVDFAPSCGNMLAAVGPFAIEQGLVTALPDATTISIHNVNTDALIDAVVRTSAAGDVLYSGDTSIDGVPGTASPIICRYKNIAGSKTSGLLPTGNPSEQINGIDVSLIDVSVPMMMLRAQDVGLTGSESKAEIDANSALFELIESMRLQAGNRMGLGDVSESVVPKVALLSKPRKGGSITSRYLVPDRCHAAHAVTGGMCVASCCQLKGSIADGLADIAYRDQEQIIIEHPSGVLDVEISVSGHDQQMQVEYAAVVRTARKLFQGEVFIPISQE